MQLATFLGVSSLLSEDEKLPDCTVNPFGDNGDFLPPDFFAKRLKGKAGTKDEERIRGW